ncbi:MAG: DUF433 domain-containing protein [Fimbriimonadaceae bacterium]|nr:DUF433 domain-containing protein [Chitinophagales bacterium]
MHDRISINSQVMLGKPVIKGTRITVESIIERLASGETISDILEAHPHIIKEDVLAVLDFTASLLKGENIYPVAI